MNSAMALADKQGDRLQPWLMAADLNAQLLAKLRANPFLLAPMAAITDSCFRSFMRELGCGILTSELISAHGIEHRSERTIQLMHFEEDQRPVGIQLFGETPEVLASAAKFIEESGADFVDLNFGCPVPKVVKKGAGSAILKDLPQVEKVFRAVRAGTKLPVTVKIRTGWDEPTRNAEKVAEIAYNEGLSWVAIHGRTRAAGYAGLADWDYIAEVKAKSKIPIIGNGDINSPEIAVRRLKESGCDGVMIGRGCLKNPWIFSECLALYSSEKAEVSEAPVAAESLFSSPFLGADKQPIAAPGKIPVKNQASRYSGASAVGALDGGNDAYNKDFVSLFLKLKASFERLPTEARGGYPVEKITTLQIKKFASWYSSGYPGASNFRKSIFQTQTLPEVMDRTLAFFTGLRAVAQADTSHEAFLMGGHG